MFVCTYIFIWLLHCFCKTLKINDTFLVTYKKLYIHRCNCYCCISCCMFNIHKYVSNWKYTKSSLKWWAFKCICVYVYAYSSMCVTLGWSRRTYHPRALVSEALTCNGRFLLNFFVAFLHFRFLSISSSYKWENIILTLILYCQQIKIARLIIIKLPMH